MAGDREELVFALCHEVGNLLAASRLEAYLKASFTRHSSSSDKSGEEGVAVVALFGGDVG